MKRFTRILASALLMFAVMTASSASENGIVLQEVDVNIHNSSSLQRGAKYFVNYCLSCHNSRYARYKWVGIDLGLTEEMVKENLIFTDKRINDLMSVSMPRESAIEWFGAFPPDLTLVARSRGANWIYTYMKSFYLDDKRPHGVNNTILKGSSMPHVLWEMQGWQELVETQDAQGNKLKQFKLATPGTMSEKEYDKVIKDLVTFLVYLAEPAALKRQVIGKWVLLFLFFFLGMSYFLYREYWRDVH